MKKESEPSVRGEVSGGHGIGEVRGLPPGARRALVDVQFVRGSSPLPCPPDISFFFHFSPLDIEFGKVSRGYGRQSILGAFGNDGCAFSLSSRSNGTRLCNKLLNSNSSKHCFLWQSLSPFFFFVQKMHGPTLLQQ